MARTIGLFLMRAAGLFLAGLLLFAVFSQARAQTSRFSPFSGVAVTAATAAVIQ
jgi:hypothetical protein